MLHNKTFPILLLLSFILFIFTQRTFISETSNLFIIKDYVSNFFLFLSENIHCNGSICNYLREKTNQLHLSTRRVCRDKHTSTENQLFVSDNQYWNDVDYEARYKKSNCFTLALVTDLDHSSKIDGELKWKSYVRLIRVWKDEISTLHVKEDETTEQSSSAGSTSSRSSTTQSTSQSTSQTTSRTASTSSPQSTFHFVNMIEKPVFSEWNRKNRGMELSALVWANKKLLAFCDVTGIVYELDLNPTIASPKYILAVGDTAFKSEWATIKDGYVYVGSIGKEWVTNMKPDHTLMERIQKISLRTGKVTQELWHDQYMALREAVNATWPGYIIHEGVVWHPTQRKWYFLPRKVSHDVLYTEESDERMGSNILLIADENFKNIETRLIGPFENDFGFSDLELLYDNIFAAIKVREHADSGTDAKLVIFDSSTGEILSEWYDLGRKKYEGMTMISNSCSFHIE